MRRLLGRRLAFFGMVGRAERMHRLLTRLLLLLWLSLVGVEILIDLVWRK